MNHVRALIAMLLLLPALALACGDDDDAGETSSPSQSAEATTARVAPTPRPPTPSPTPYCGPYAGTSAFRVVDAVTGQLSELGPGVVSPYGYQGAWSSEVTDISLACGGAGAALFNPVAGELWDLVGPPDGRYHWSPDGQRVALIETENPSPSLVESTVSLIETGVGNPTEVWSGGRVQAIRWSTDGEYLAIASEVFREGWGMASEVAVYDLGGKFVSESPTNFSVGLLDVSVDGRLAFASSFPVGVRELAVVDADGTAVSIFSSEHTIDRLTWSSDGATLAFSVNKFGSDADLYLWSDGLGEPRVIAAGWYPAWSPDGASLLFVDDFCGRSDVIISDGTGNKRILSEGVDAYVSEVAWSRDGSRVAFNGEVGPDAGLWIVNADGSELAKLTEPSPLGLGWSLDGTSLYGILPGGRDFCLNFRPTSS